MKKTYVIGDVHGNFDTLMKLIEKLPENYDLIFVGDLIDRGEKSRKVIDFVRSNNYRCVLGNHEDMMIEMGEELCKNISNEINYYHLGLWIGNGGDSTLKEYNLFEFDKENIEYSIINDEKGVIELKRDIEWMKNLPLYIELDNKINNKKVLITHASSADYFPELKEDESFKEIALWRRIEPSKDTNEYFNIFGHTINLWGPKIKENFVNVDTGCFLNKHGYGILSAYCIENGETLSVQRV